MLDKALKVAITLIGLSSIAWGTFLMTKVPHALLSELLTVFAVASICGGMFLLWWTLKGKQVLRAIIGGGVRP